jgi:hypothetical protein
VELECKGSISSDRFTVLLGNIAQDNGGIVCVAVNCSDNVRVCLGNLGKEVEVAGGESSCSIDDAMNSGAIVTAKCQLQLNGEVGECSLDRNRKNPTSGRGREDLDNAAHEEHSGA